LATSHSPKEKGKSNTPIVEKNTPYCLNDSNKRQLAECIKASLGELNKEVASVTVRVDPIGRVKMPSSTFLIQASAQLASAKLSSSTCRVLLFLLSQSEYQNYIGIDIKSICDSIDMSKKSVINALSSLVNEGVILKITNATDRRRHDYFINPLVAWKGKSFNRKKQIGELLISDQPPSLFGQDFSTVYKNERK
jgi:hypothetical protein